MTDIAHALASGGQVFQQFGGHDVIEARVEIPGAGGGLRESMKFAPVELDPDDEVTVVLRCRVKSVKFVKSKGTDLLIRVHVLEPVDEGGAFVDDDLVAQMIGETQRKTRQARDAAAGIQSLDLSGEDAGIYGDEDDEDLDEGGDNEDGDDE